MTSRLLVVDDDTFIRKLMQLHLASSGYEVHQAASGEDAIRLFDEMKFDVIFLDLILPHFGGFRLCQKFKSSVHPPWIIIMTGDDSAETRASAKEYGANDFLPKPFTLTDMTAKLEAVKKAESKKQKAKM